MLLYVATEHDADFARYDERYAANPFSFPIHVDNARFAAQLMQEMAAIDELSVLEIGCGQGQYLSGILDVATFLRGYAHRVQAIGLDGSSVAIRQAAERDNRIDWVADRVQRFIASHSNRYDLILDRGGNTVMADAADARAMLAAVAGLLKPGGVYSYVISRSWYASSMRADFHPGYDWIALASERFAHLDDRSTPAQHQLCFRAA